MAKNNEVVAKVRVTIGGVEASKKNLNALQTSADELAERIKQLNKQKVKLVDANDVKGADAVVKEMNKVNAALKATKQMIQAQEMELNNYTNILDSLSNTKLTNLQKGLRDLQAQMKATLTLDDVQKYGKLKAAYDELLSAVDQLSGKVPNLSYVLKNLGKVADKTLSDSIAYTEKLIASTDKTTKRGRDNIKAWTADLKRMRQEMADRSIKVLDNPQSYSTEQIQQSIAALKKLQPALRQGSQEWDKYAQYIKAGEQALKAYEEKQKALSDKAMRMQTDKVLANPAGFSQEEVENAIKYAEKLQKTYNVGSPWWIHYKNGIDAAKQSLESFNQKQKEAEERAKKLQTDKVLSNPNAAGITQQQMEDAIRHGKELQKQQEIGGKEWVDYANKIKLAEERLKSYDAKQKEMADTQRAQAAIADAGVIKQSDGTFDITADEAKARAEAIEKYINTLNMSSQADDIQKATDALNVYNQALGKVKDTSVNVQEILKDPKNFSAEQIEQGIRQLEAAGKAISPNDTAAIQANVDSILKLKQALADTGYSQTFIDRVIQDASKGEASVEELEKAIAMVKEKLRHSKDATVTEKLKQQLDKLNPALNLTKTSLERVTATLGNVKAANLGSLKEAAERLKIELNDVNIKMDDFNRKAAQLKQVNERIKELEAQTKNVSSAWDNAVSRLKNWVLIYAGSSEIFNKMVQAYQGSLKLSDAMTDVQKTTGLAADEVVRLTDEVQELDTRITNEKLMEAATEAGRIGLKTRKEVLEFTRASAITLTALDELDARSITSVMKLNSLLGETARLGVQQAILSTASSINELSMASSAAQQPIIDFSRRFGGIAAQANISTAEVLGLGATIDALGQPVEMSSTALNKFTTALLSNGKAIAEDTGLSEEYIFEMIRQRKTIELMIEVLSKLSTMGGIGEISKYMGDMGGDGARMTAVISALAANLGFLRKNLDLSTQSFEEGSSVINEYNLKNENAAALVARIANEIKESFVNSTTVRVLTTFLGLLQSLVHFMLSGTVAAKAFNAVLILIVSRIATMNKTIRSLNDSLRLQIMYMLQGEGSFLSWKGLLSAVTAGVKGFGRALKSVFASNPLGWLIVGASLLVDFVSGLFDAEKQTEKIKPAIDRANEAFEEESYKLNKLRDALDAAKKSGDGFAEVVSTLNRDYGKQIGYVLDLAASYEEVAGAIDLAVAAKRRQILQEEKDKNFQQVQDEYRDETNDQINALKKAIGIGSAKGRFDDFSETVQKELYAAIASDLNKSASVAGKAELGKEVEAVLRRQAKAAAMTYYRKSTGMTDEELAKFDTSGKEKVLYDMYKQRLNSISSIEELAEIYTNKANKIKELDEEVNRQLDAQTEVVADLQQKQIDLISEQNNLANKAAKDYTADDEHTLNSIVSLYESMLTNMSADMDKTKWDEINEELTFFKARQREVMLAFVENPLRGVKMKVGEDGKLYKEVMANGKLQYESVKELSDANLRQLVDAYRRTESTFQKLISDENHLMDSKVREQADKLSKVKIAINRELQKNGIDIDDKGELKLRRTEFRDGSARTARQEDSEGRKAYEALLNNLKEYYEKRKQLMLDDFVNGVATVEQKNRRIEEIERLHRDSIVAMQTELLGESTDTSLFDEKTLIRDQTNWKRVLDWILKDTHHFQDKVRADRDTLIRENLDSMAQYKEEVARIILGNDYQAQVDKEMQDALEKAGLFWGKMQKRTAENADAITAAMKEAAKDSYAIEADKFRTMLEENKAFGDTVKAMNEEQYAAFLILLQQFHDKTIEADKKFADQRRKITQQMWESGGYENEYNFANDSIKNRQENLSQSKDFGATSDKKAYEEQYRLTLEQWALEEWRFQMQYDLAIKAGETEEQLLARRMEMAEMEKEMQRQVTEAYLEEYNRRADKMAQHAEKFGEFAGVMASAAWNTVEDRKKAGEELLRYIAQESAEYIRELLVRKIKEEVLRRQGLKEAKKGEEEKQDIEQKGVEASTKISEIGGKIKTGIEEKVAGEVSDIATSGAAKSATTAVKKANVDAAAGAASGAAKTIGELGWWGIPLIAAIEGVISMLLNMAFSALSSSFGTSASTNKASSKRLATGMLTYASGRYPTMGDDGVTYDAQYEPRLQTQIYQGGKGKAHMALFSEVMPEMVISGPTTKIIQEDFPGLMNAIMMIDKYGTLPQPRRVRRYADGNMDEFDVDMAQGADGVFAESPAIAELRQSNAELRQAVAVLSEKLSNPIPVYINMYGTGGIKESMDKANKFYTKNRIKS